MPPKIKVKNAPNQHDKRHESGLAPPGKRVAKKQSNGHLNGQPNGKPVAAGQAPALPTSSSSQEGVPQATGREHAGSLEGGERDRTQSDASLEEGGQCGVMGDPHVEQAPQLTGGEVSSGASRNTAPLQAGSTCNSISTILAYYPLRDAISILILLLSLPPTFILIIQTLFASLTFVPPTTSISLSTINIKEMFNSANLGYPAMATILIVDLIFWLCWLPLWKPVQAILLDLSQAVIAVSLSGAAASTGGPTYSIATCTTIVCFVHIMRFKPIHLTGLDYLRSVLHKTGIDMNLDGNAFAASYVSPSFIDSGWSYTVFRIILGIHIVSQGVTTCIRRSLVKANEQGANLPAITKTDTEAAAGTEPNSRLSTGLVESTQLAVSVSPSDGRQPGPSPANRDNKARETSSKKKRKQANQVRSQQPLWAAIASTKVTFKKEMEHRDAIDDSRETTCINTNTRHNGTEASNTTPNRIWIREVRDTEILLGAELSASAAKMISDHDSSSNTGCDKSKSFYVRINGADWSSARVNSIDATDGSNCNTGEYFEVQIFGLTPLNVYRCDIMSFSDHKFLCTISIITQPAPVLEQAAATATPPTHQSLRPASPITSLKQSIQTADNKLTETRNRSKKNKKDHRAGHADVKRELNTLKSKVDTSGGSDDKQDRRIMQFKQHKAQAEEATAEVKEQIDAMGEIPANEVTQSETSRTTWQTASNAKRDANKELDGHRADSDRHVNTVKSDIGQVDSKREKLAARLVQRKDERGKALSKQQEDMSAKERREYERVQKRQQWQQDESNARAHIASLEDEASMFQQKTHDAYQQISSLQAWSQQPPPYYSSPPTPETAHPSAAGIMGSPQSNSYANFGAQQYASPFHSAQQSIGNAQAGPRGRSSSMLSQYSGFTDGGEEYNVALELPRHQLAWPLHGGAMLTDDRKASEGSGSGSLNNDSTGSNSPRPDAKVFIPGKSPGVVGPIGPPSKSKEKTSQSPVTSPGAIGSGR